VSELALCARHRGDASVLVELLADGEHAKVEVLAQA
jgi:hypothetical protein